METVDVLTMLKNLRTHISNVIKAIEIDRPLTKSSAQLVEEVYALIVSESTKYKNGGVPEGLIRDMLMREMPIYSVRQTLLEMQHSQWIDMSTGEEGQRLIFAKRKLPPTQK